VRNLRGRLTLGVSTVLAVVLTIAGVLVARDVESSERDAVDDTLMRTAEVSRATAITAVEQELPAVDSRLEDVLRASGSSLRLSIGGKQLVSAGRGAPGKLPLGLHSVAARGTHYRTYAETLRDASLGGLVRLEVSTSLRPLEHRQAALRRRLALIFGGVLLVAALGVWLAADLVLRPLRRLRAGTAQIATEADLARPVGVEGPTELRALASSFNAMLARLRRSAEDRNRALAATRRFTADAGHELRTPLTSVQAALSSLARHPELPAAQRTAMAEDALAEQRRLVALLDGLQALARGDAGPVEHVGVELGELVDGALAAARARWPATAFSAELPDADITLLGWEPGLRMLVDNLLANAARHGAGQVAVTLRAGGPQLVVEDDGPGIADADRARVFEPFARVEGRDRPGSGLGLALVAQQARLHGARVEIGDAELGGARLTVTFNATDPAA
jgi:two-component system sensor histidine kinase PrrB